LETVIFANFITAHAPSLNGIGDVERAADIRAIYVISQEWAKKRLSSGEERHLTEPSDVLLESVSRLVSLFLTINHDSLDTADFVEDLFHLFSLEWHAVLRISLSEEIIPVESLPQLVDLVPEIFADGVVGVRAAHISEIVGALVLCVVLD
jgi:hypothetical protein